MAEVVEQPTTESLGWRAGLPDDLKTNEAFVPYKTVGEFAKAHLATATKAKELEGKLGNSIPKLSENATPEEREQFFNSLGRPEKPEGYELDGEDKNAKEWTGYWRNEMHKIGVPKDQAKAISVAFNKQINGMVEAHNAKIQAEISETSTKLKTELGDKYDASVELASRLWKRDTDVDLDKAFPAETSAGRTAVIRYILKMAAKTGEDSSLRGAQPRKPNVPGTFINYDKSPAPPSRHV
jgi:hypothetical protein